MDIREPLPQWSAVGTTSNAEYYVTESGVLICWPHLKTVDDGATARENIAFQHDHFAELGKPGKIIIFFDRLASQTAEARDAYSRTMSTQLVAAVALVGGTMLTRALVSFFMGLKRPRIPSRFFGGYDEALLWLSSH